ncbi:hypothetical protein [Noviherbaspirillum malthae]|uniref:hypothetical protein n=1 Tax=Noviherbaspirillum malthae TaxID=1260987 RepID=UPI00188E335A|nr:hypothetical protein [Noviherbaspirillum malthae]
MNTIFDKAIRPVRPCQQPGIYIIEEFAKTLLGTSVSKLQGVSAGAVDMIFRVMPAYSIIGIWITLNYVYNAGPVIAAIEPELTGELPPEAGSLQIDVHTTVVMREAPHVVRIFFGSFSNTNDVIRQMQQLPMHPMKPHALN